MGVLRTKSIEQSIRDTEESEHKLKKDLSAWDLTVFGIGVIVLRRTRPDLPRAFRTPAVPLIPMLAVIACVFLMLNLGT